MPEQRVAAQIALTHPCLPGHFPGRPVVPGVLLMERVLDALQAWRGPHWRLQQVHAMKFLQPLLPGERFEIVLHLNGTRLDFCCERDEQVLARGSWELGT